MLCMCCICRIIDSAMHLFYINESSMHYMHTVVCLYLREECESSPDIIRDLPLDEAVALWRNNRWVDEAKEDGRVDSVHR